MKFINLKKYVTLLVIVAFAFSACKKVKTVDPQGDAGQTLVKLLGGGTPAEISKKPIDFLPTPTKIVAVEVRRDVPNNTELNRAMVVTVKDDTAAVRLAGYLHLNPIWFTSQVADGVKAGGQGGTWTINFKPGEFSKTIFVTIPNATLLDPSSLYGLGFTLLTADASGIVSAQKSLIVEIGAKNQYDGEYSLKVKQTGWAAFGIADGLSLDYPGNIALVTLGANSCYLSNLYTGTNLLAGFSAGPPPAATQFGATTPAYVFNPATNAIANIYNTTPTDGRDRFLFLNPAVTDSRYDPATKKIYAAYFMTQLTRPSQFFYDTLTYVKPR